MPNVESRGVRADQSATCGCLPRAPPAICVLLGSRCFRCPRAASGAPSARQPPNLWRQLTECPRDAEFGSSWGKVVRNGGRETGSGRADGSGPGRWVSRLGHSRTLQQLWLIASTQGETGDWPSRVFCVIGWLITAFSLKMSIGHQLLV